MNACRSIIIITTPPHTSAAPREGLDAALALAVFNLDVSVILHGAGVLHAIDSPRPETDLPTFHGSLFMNLGALEMYDIPKVRVLEQQWIRYHQPPPPAWIELTSSLADLFVDHYQVHVY